MIFKTLKFTGFMIMIAALALCVEVFESEDHKKKKIVWLVNAKDPFSGPEKMNNGYLAEIVSEAMYRSGFESAFEYVTDGKPPELIEGGEYIGLLSSDFTGETGTGGFVYSDEIVGSDVVLISRNDVDVTYTSHEDLNGYRIGIIRGDSCSEGFDPDDTLTKVYMSPGEDYVAALMLNRVDMVLASQKVMESLIQHRNPEIAGQLKIIGSPFKKQAFFAMFNGGKGEAQNYLNQFNRGLNSMKSDGTFDAITKKYFRVSI